MQVAVIGARGQLGTDLISILGDDALALDIEEIDITIADDVASLMRKVRPGFVINAAAYNLVDRAEEEPEVAYRVNAIGPRNLAISCSEVGAKLLHVSTDFVFGLDSQRTTPYRETDPPGPLSAYGLSKLAGEYFVRSLCPQHFVVRTCGLYGVECSRGKGNFVETMLRLGAERDALDIVNDQRCTPSWTMNIARAIVALMETEQFGLYHATDSGDMTWYEFAAEIFRQSGMTVKLNPITSADFGAAAQRPAYSVLDCGKLTEATGVELPAWQSALAEYLQKRPGGAA